jgi:4a-hydroxytetrahydrobiopterin dehydratase
MVERITARRFHEAVDVDDWRVLFGGAFTYFRTGSFAKGVALVDAVGRLADAANHHPDVDLRYPGVTVGLTTREVGGLSERDIEAARQISAAARELGITADPSAVQAQQVSIDVGAVEDVRPFWRAVLGYKDVDDDALADPHGRGAAFRFRRTDGPRPEHHRVHLDVAVPHDQAEARVAAALAAGGRLVTDGAAPARWTLADPEGNVVDVATWRGRD